MGLSDRRRPGSIAPPPQPVRKSYLYPDILQTATPKNSPIKSYADLKSKNFSPDKLTFSGNVTVERLLGHYGVPYKDIKAGGGTIYPVGYTDSAALMKDGHVDARVALTNVLNSSFIALDFQHGIQFLPIETKISDKFVQESGGMYWLSARQ